MKLSTLLLKNFKHISDGIIDLSQPITVFIGKNNSGKSSILEAIFSCLRNIDIKSPINRSLKTGEVIVELSFYLSPEEWSKLFNQIGESQYYLTPEECSLFKDIMLKIRKKWIYVENKISESRELDYTANFLTDEKYSKYSDHFKAIRKLQSTNLALLFGVMKLNPAGQQVSYIGQFKPYNQIKIEDVVKEFNVWIHHIKRRSPKEYEEFCNEFKSLFPEIENFRIEFDQDIGFVKIIVTERGQISSHEEMGSGWHSILLCYSFLMAQGFNIIIIDEPCVHMHASSIKLMAKYFLKISEKKQLILATHNFVLINNLPLSSLIFLDIEQNGKYIPKRLKTTIDTMETLKKIGILVDEELISDFNELDRTKAAQIVLEKINPKIDITSELWEKIEDSILSYYPEKKISLDIELKRNSDSDKLAKKLLRCSYGREGWVQYQNICKEILSYAFSPPLLKPREQIQTDRREQRRDLIMHIPHDISGFWSFIQRQHNSIAIIIECKNYEDLLNKEEVTKTSSYFSDMKLGKFGLLLTRKGLDNGANEEIKRLWTDHDLRIMILSLNDNDLINILKIKEYGENPELYIDALYRKFRESIYR